MSDGADLMEPDLDRVFHSLQLELTSLASKFDQLVARVNALDDHQNKLVSSLTRTFKEKNLSARLGQLEKRQDSLINRVSVVEEKGINFRGTWQRAQNYARGDLVGFDGSGWVAIADVAPLEEPGRCAKWQLFIKKGKDARDGNDVEPRQATRGGTRQETTVSRRTP